MKNKGIVPDSCMPYVSGNGVTTPCPTTCNGTNVPISSKLYYAKSYQHISPWMWWKKVEEIQQDIYDNGPVQTGKYVELVECMTNILILLNVQCTTNCKSSY